MLEKPNSLLVDFLLDAEYIVYFVPPNISVRHRPRRSKSDRGDAHLLASLLWRDDPECRQIAVVSSLCHQLRQVVAAHDSLQAQLQRLGGQLRHHLKRYYPAILTIFRKPTQPLTYAFLEDFPDPHTDFTLLDLKRFFAAQRYRYSERIEGHLQVLLSERPTRQDTGGEQSRTAATVAVLRTLDQQIRALHKQLVRLFRAHPNATWIRSLPGVGELNGARLLARLGDNRSRFEDVAMLRATAGTVPITRSSGKRRSVHFRQDCSRPLRKVCYDLAMKSKAKSPWARGYFEAQRARGHSAIRANRALANRWVGIIWKLWETDVLYDDAKHLTNCQHTERAIA